MYQYRAVVAKLWPSRCCLAPTSIMPDQWPCLLWLMGAGVQQLVEVYRLVTFAMTYTAHKEELN